MALQSSSDEGFHWHCRTVIDGSRRHSHRCLSCYVAWPSSVLRRYSYALPCDP